MAIQDSSRSTLTILEAPVAWSRFEPELATVIARAIRTMGLGNARRGVASGNIDGIGRAPSTTSVRLRLLRDIDLASDIRVAVEDEFHRSVARGGVWRENASGWLNRVATRSARRLATRRARLLLAEVDLQDESPVDRLPDDAHLPDELLRQAGLREVLSRLIRALGDIERELLGLSDMPRDDAALAVHLDISPGALRVRRHRLLASLRSRVFQELGYDEEAAE